MTQEIAPFLEQDLASTDLTEEYCRLIEAYGLEPSQANDTYSLAQPSPYRFVPTIASNHTTPWHEGE